MAARNMKKLIREYDERVSRRQQLDYLGNELSQVIEMSGDPLDLAYNALRAGYMAGWKASKKDSRAAARRTKKSP